MRDELERISVYSVTEGDKDRRIDVFLSSQVKEFTRSRIQSLIREGHVKVNELPPKTSYRIRTGDIISLSIPPVESYFLQPEPVEFSLVHEDSSIIVLNKPPGLVIHPAPGHTRGTLVHGLLTHCRDLSGIGGVLRPGIVHRLDKDTSGLMVVAKNDSAHHFLGKQFKEGRIHKKYLALVHGVISGNKGEIDLPIGRHPKRRKEMAVTSSGGKTAITLWRKKEEIGDRFTLLEVTLKTGRTHQIRVHFSHLGHPIVGDKVYGYRKRGRGGHYRSLVEITSQINRQMLHSEYLGLIHPASGAYCEFTAPIPADMEALIRNLKKLFYERRNDNP